MNFATVLFRAVHRWATAQGRRRSRLQPRPTREPDRPSRSVKPDHCTLRQDDSPPGHKILWHH